MSGTYVLRKNPESMNFIQGLALGGLGVGNVYHVIKTDETYYAQFVADHQMEYSDGSMAVYSADPAAADVAIQKALDACVESRGDYVIIQPSTNDYDLTATLTLSKRSVHLLCPSGIGPSIGATGACRIHQTAAVPIMTVTANAVEIAGFYLKNYYAKGGIIITDTAFSLNIHNNYWAMYLSGSTNEPMLGPLLANTTGAAGAWSTFERNFFQSQAGASATIAALIHFNAQATGVVIVNNRLAIGDTNNTASIGIDNQSVKGIVSDNDFYAHQTSTGAGVFTKCVSVGASGCAFGNRGNVANSVIVTGGTQHYSFVDNRISLNGGYGGGTANASGGDEA
jgi:hypothetical protein